MLVCKHPKHLSPRRLSAVGFTLLELMVTLAIVAILAMLAAPNIQDTIAKNRMQAIGRQISTDILHARNQSVSKNTCTIMCVSSSTATAITQDANGGLVTGPSCDSAIKDEKADWQKGWLVILKEDCVNNNNAAPLQPTNVVDYLVIREPLNANYKLITDPSNYRIEFDPQGNVGVNGAGTFIVQYLDQNSDYTKRFGFNICLNATGRTRQISGVSSC